MKLIAIILGPPMVFARCDDNKLWCGRRLVLQDTAQKPYIKSILHAAGHSRDDFAVNNSLFRCFGDKDGEIELQEVCRTGCVTMQDDEGFNDACRPGDGSDDRHKKDEVKAPTAKTTTTEVHVIKLHPETDTYIGKAQIKTISRSS